MSNDERPDSLAAQAAAWVPPWERPQRPPDRDFQAAAEAQARAEEAGDEQAVAGHGEPGDDSQRDVAQPGDNSQRDVAQPGDDSQRDVAQPGDDLRGGGAEAGDDAERGVAGPGDDADRAEFSPQGRAAGNDDDAPPAEEPALGEAGEGRVGVDSPGGEDYREADGSGVGPELPLPEPIEQAADAPAQDDEGLPVDAPLPPEGDDAGDVFDAAADDDVSDDGEVDLPFSEEVPSGAPAEDTGAEADPDPAQDAEPVDDRVGSRPAARAAVGVPGQGRGIGTSLRPAAEASPRTDDLDLPGLTDDAELAAALEAIMLVVDEPVAELQLAQILEQPTERIARTLDNLSARYTAAGHGFDLRRVAGGWRLYTRPEYAAYVERFVLDGQSVRLTQAALETLAVVAYKQPVTRSRISAIRGVNCDGVMRTLVTRGLIEECGTEGETGAHLYRTTSLFLEKLGLNSVDQLPPLAPFLPDDVEEVLDASG